MNAKSLTGQAAVSPEAPAQCGICPRLAAFRKRWRDNEPNWYNGAVSSFGDPKAALLIVGLAPGLRGANRTGRPFTGDFAGDLLYRAIARYGFSEGTYAANPNDGLKLKNCMITNAVRCVPPENKPRSQEINACRSFLAARILAMPKLKAILCLGKISHDSVVRAFGARPAHFPFAHGALHIIENIKIFDSYHCSRYNTNTRKLTENMFFDVFAQVKKSLSSAPKMSSMRRLSA